jgi:DNA-binding Lrp family transcriptional regulator
MSPHDALDARLLNDWQQQFPLCPQPFDEVAASLGCAPFTVLERLQALLAHGSVSRIGGIWNPGAGGAALLCAMAVPPQRLEAVAALVSAHPGVNHNYEREHAYNLWFVLTGADAEAVELGVQRLEQRSSLTILRLPMQRAYRINLGFDLRQANSDAKRSPEGVTRSRVEAVAPADRALAALVEQGLPLGPRPYAAWARALGWTEAAVLDRMQQWLASGTLRRFGVVVRHHELGFAANAMCVFDVPDDAVDAHATLLAHQEGVTLCYRRARAPGWPYNLYCMVHGRAREDVELWLQNARHAAGLVHVNQARLYSLRRFKQCGASYFRSSTTPDPLNFHRSPYKEALSHA